MAEEEPLGSAAGPRPERSLMVITINDRLQLKPDSRHCATQRDNFRQSLDRPQRGLSKSVFPPSPVEEH